MLKGRLRVMYVNQAPSPVLVVLRAQWPLDAVPEAYHNSAAVWWGPCTFLGHVALNGWSSGPGLLPLGPCSWSLFSDRVSAEASGLWI